MASYISLVMIKVKTNKEKNFSVFLSHPKTSWKSFKAWICILLRSTIAELESARACDEFIIAIKLNDREKKSAWTFWRRMLKFTVPDTYIRHEFVKNSFLTTHWSRQHVRFLCLSLSSFMNFTAKFESNGQFWSVLSADGQIYKRADIMNS